MRGFYFRLTRHNIYTILLVLIPRIVQANVFRYKNDGLESAHAVVGRKFPPLYLERCFPVISPTQAVEVIHTSQRAH